jgi:hypothetical protein
LGKGKFVENWHYVYDGPISDTQYVVEATIDFTVVLPAVMSTIFLFNRFFEAYGINFEGRSLLLRQMSPYFLAVVGFIGLVLIVLFPKIAFPLVWIAPIFLLESVPRAFNCPSLFKRLESGNYTLAVSISAATLFNGIIWEIWNYYSSPKWVYTIPYVGFLKIFEMPLLGYLGYPFFGMIVYNFVLLLFACIRGVYRAKQIENWRGISNPCRNILECLPDHGATKEVRIVNRYYAAGDSIAIRYFVTAGASPHGLICPPKGKA